MNAYVATLPTVAFLPILVAHRGQSFVGGWVAARLAESHPMHIVLIVGVLSLVGGIANMLVVAWLAGRIEVRLRD